MILNEEFRHIYKTQEDLKYSNWQATTSRGMISVALQRYGYMVETGCDIACGTGTFFTEENKLQVPVYALAAANPKFDCQSMKYEGVECE